MLNKRKMYSRVLAGICDAVDHISMFIFTQSRTKPHCQNENLYAYFHSQCFTFGLYLKIFFRCFKMTFLGNILLARRDTISHVRKL